MVRMPIFLLRIPKLINILWYLRMVAINPEKGEFWLKLPWGR